MKIKSLAVNICKKCKSKILSKQTVILIFSFLIIAGLFILPTGYEGAVQFKDAEKCRARIISVDNSRIIDTGLIRTGQQVCEIEFLSGKFKGQKTEGESVKPFL